MRELTVSLSAAIIFAMTLKTKIQDDIKAALKSGDKHRLAALRLTLASIKNAGNG